MASRKKAAKNLEKGICILCGGEKQGAPAIKDTAISSARKLRKLLGMEERHTIACSTCLPMCAGKRAAFEKMLARYRLYAISFVLVLIIGSAVLGGFSLWLILPVIIGAAIILLLPYGYYFPKFEITEKK